MHKTDYKKKQPANFSTINSLVRILNYELQNNPLLYNELLQFLNDKKIHVPALSQKDLSELIPVSYANKNNTKQMHKLKGAFEGVEAVENLI